MTRCLIFTLVLLFSQVLSLNAQDLIRNTSVTGVCYAGTRVNRIYIPPPKGFLSRKDSKGGGTITVIYTGFSAQAKMAVQYAVKIVEDILPADTKFTIDASWERISTSGVLAQSTITGYAGGFGIDALNPFAIYPVALAEKIAGRSINDDAQGDITLQVNSTINWYLGTDGNTPPQRYDLVTVAIHEICHGLGIFDSFSLDGSTGYYGLNSLPMIYDTFVENTSGNKLTDTLRFSNNSNDLGTQLTGNGLYFNGPLLRRHTTEENYPATRAKLFAPSAWDEGSSISHLDEPESVTLPKNSLMTPYIDLGEAIHDPGKYTHSILGDLGWINTRIIHEPAGDTEESLTHLVLSVVVKSDTTYNRNRVGVVFSFNNFVTSDTLYLASPSSNDNFSTSIDIPAYNTELQYYFFAEDAFTRLYRSPSVFRDTRLLKNNRYHTFIGTDTSRPVVTHIPLPYYLQRIDSLRFEATAIDNIGIDSVYLEYKVNNGPSRFVRMEKGNADSYKTVLSANSLSRNAEDSIQYKIFAVDSAADSNLGSTPVSDYYVIDIEEIAATLPGYSTDFSNASADFFNIGFDISKPAGFLKYGLNSEHPYESPEDNEKTLDFFSILRHPIKFDESGVLISFNELVLVEPGEDGSVFGSSDFFDYVILEGSKNFGVSWFQLTDGYDSRYFPEWETAYNSSIVGNNSTFIGTESMLQKHTLLCRPSANISAGDTLLLRFRLFSDPYANGWGWVIEDLKINPLVDALPETARQTITVYPNPGTGLINISFDKHMQQNYKPVPYRIFNTSGICLVNSLTSGTSETIVDISEYPAGLYIILLYLDDGVQAVKYSLTK